MAEGWIVLGVFLGSLGTLATAYATQRWTRQATIASERRQTRVDERRQAVAPIRAFLDKAARASGRQFVEEVATSAYDDNIEGLQQIGRREEVLDLLTSDVQEEPSVHDLTREAVVTVATAPTRILAVLVIAVHAMAVKRGRASTAHLRQAIESTRRAVEDYIVGGLEDATDSR